MLCPPSLSGRVVLAPYPPHTCLSFFVAVAMTLDVKDLEAPPVVWAPSTHLTWPWDSYHFWGLGRPPEGAVAEERNECQMGGRVAVKDIIASDVCDP